MKEGQVIRIFSVIHHHLSIRRKRSTQGSIRETREIINIFRVSAVIKIPHFPGFCHFLIIQSVPIRVNLIPIRPGYVRDNHGKINIKSADAQGSIEIKSCFCCIHILLHFTRGRLTLNNIHMHDQGLHRFNRQGIEPPKPKIGIGIIQDGRHGCIIMLKICNFQLKWNDIG